MAPKKYVFSPGPATLPREVLENASRALLDFQGTGISILETSHRSKVFEELLEKTKRDLKFLLEIPDSHETLFLQGGASLQFHMAPLNLFLHSRPVDALHTGYWTGKAIKEIEKLGPCHVAGSGESADFKTLPEKFDWSDQPSFVYLASNNTIHGTQWKTFPEHPSAPLVADMTSDILSRPIKVSKFGLIFASAQKNLGCAGLTLAIIDRELAERCAKTAPTMLQYRTHIEKNSLYNTAPTFAIYIASLMLDWLKQNGGVAGIESLNLKKAALLYDYIDQSALYRCPVNISDRSTMNAVFRIGKNDTLLEQEFLLAAEREGLIGLKGHPSAGGIRASLYNALPLEAVETLVAFMERFSQAHLA